MARKKPEAEHDGDDGEQGNTLPLNHATSGAHAIGREARDSEDSELGARTKPEATRGGDDGEQGDTALLNHATSGAHAIRREARDSEDSELDHPQETDDAERPSAPNEPDLDRLLAAEDRPPPLDRWSLGITLGFSALAWYLIWLTWPASGYVFAGLLGLLGLDFAWRRYRRRH